MCTISGVRLSNYIGEIHWGDHVKDTSPLLLVFLLLLLLKRITFMFLFLKTHILMKKEQSMLVNNQLHKLNAVCSLCFTEQQALKASWEICWENKWCNTLWSHSQECPKPFLMPDGKYSPLMTNVLSLPRAEAEASSLGMWQIPGWEDGTCYQAGVSCHPAEGSSQITGLRCDWSCTECTLSPHDRGGEVGPWERGWQEMGW